MAPGLTGRRQIAGAACLISVAAAIASTYLQSSAARLNDLKVFVAAGHAVIHGQSLYGLRTAAGYPFTYPPFAAVLFAPLDAVGFSVTQVLWLAISGLLFVAFIRSALPEWDWLWIFVAAAVLVWTVPIRNDFRFGQVEVFLAAAILFDLRRIRDAKSGGWLIGLATAIKLTPGLFIVYLLISRRWRALANSVATFAIATLVGAAVTPRQSYDYFTKIAWNYHRYGVVDSTGNQSFIGSLTRLGMHGTALSLLAAALGLAAIIVCLIRTRAESDLTAVAAVVGCASTLVSPLSWTHHFPWLLLGELVLLDRARNDRRWLAAAVALAVVIFASPLLRVDSFTISAAALVVFLPLSRAQNRLLASAIIASIV